MNSFTTSTTAIVLIARNGLTIARLENIIWRDSRSSK